MSQIDDLLPAIEKLKVRDLVKTNCPICLSEFSLTKRNIYIAKKRGQEKLYCSQICYQTDVKSMRVETICKQCSTPITRKQSQTKKVKNLFCSRSCGAIYNNAHKEHGYTRSRLEVWLEQQLIIKYPQLIFHFNKKDTIQSELDIYIPSLKLAFELNGIFHYEPIFSQAKLKATQNNDSRKFQACLEHSIELCIIDSSKQKRFTEKSSLLYMNIITQIINTKLNG